jgi:hypothetical protein
MIFQNKKKKVVKSDELKDTFTERTNNEQRYVKPFDELDAVSVAINRKVEAPESIACNRVSLLSPRDAPSDGCIAQLQQSVLAAPRIEARWRLVEISRSPSQRSACIGTYRTLASHTFKT